MGAEWRRGPPVERGTHGRAITQPDKSTFATSPLRVEPKPLWPPRWHFRPSPCRSGWRYQDSAVSRKGEIRTLLAQIKAHPVTTEKNRQIKLIESLVQQSDEVEKAGDMRQADALAERGLLLARDLVNAR